MASEDSEYELAAAAGASLVTSFIGAQVRARRVELGLMTEALANAIGLSAKALASIEAGQRRPTPQQLASLASEFGVTVPWFLEDMPESQRAPAIASSISGTNVVEFPRSARSRELDEQSSGS